jgi:hypothetical protein
MLSYLEFKPMDIMDNEIYSHVDDYDDERHEQYREDKALNECVDSKIDEMFNTLID